jgi:hypothetical protein
MSPDVNWYSGIVRPVDICAIAYSPLESKANICTVKDVVSWMKPLLITSESVKA